MVAIGGRAWEQFSSSDIQFPDQPKNHFVEVYGAGRYDFWRVAIDTFGEKPILGHGAGTYEFAWEEMRSIELPVHDAHSLYLEAFTELGVVGGLLVLGLVGSLLWCAFAAWRYAAEPQRDRYAALLAAMLAFAVGAAFDWFWEIPTLGAVFFLAAGVVVAARCDQIAADPRREGDTDGEGRRFGLTVAAMALAWISAIALVGPLLVEREIDVSPERHGQRRLRRRRRPCRNRSLDRALGGFALRAARPARRASGRLQRRDRSLRPRDRPGGPQLAVVLPALASRA